MIKLSYCTFGLTQLPLKEAIQAVQKAGYPGVELSFHRDQFNPFEITPRDIAQLRRQFESGGIEPACVATASHFFTPSRPHEPSLMSPDLAGRKRRIDLVKRGIQVARQLGVPLVTFGSGFIREEHVSNPSVNPGALLVDSIRECLSEIRSDEDITLLLEPEPGMYIETLDQAVRLVKEIESPRFALHLDLCHMYCSEEDYLGSLAAAAPYARYLHISDAEPGYNLKFIRASEKMEFNLDFASYLIYFPQTAGFLLLDRAHPLHFYDERPAPAAAARLEGLVRAAGIEAQLGHVEYAGLHAGSTHFDDEVFTYLISVPGLSFDVLERARPIITFLRSMKDSEGRPLMERRVANTLTGIVHFHEIPGRGTLDFGACFKALNDAGFSGYGSVELYHHVADWQHALKESISHLKEYL